MAELRNERIQLLHFRFSFPTDETRAQNCSLLSGARCLEYEKFHFHLPARVLDCASLKVAMAFIK